MTPTERPVPPEARNRRSRTTTFRTPRSARWKAIEQPVTPPPMMTTSALRGRLISRTPSPGGAREGRPDRPGSGGGPLDHPGDGGLHHRLAPLVQDPVAERHDAAVRLPSLALVHHLDLDANGVAGQNRAQHAHVVA